MSNITLAAVSLIVSIAVLVNSFRVCCEAIRLRNEAIKKWINDGTLTYEDLMYLGVL